MGLGEIFLEHFFGPKLPGCNQISSGGKRFVRCGKEFSDDEVQLSKFPVVFRPIICAVVYLVLIYL